MPFRDIALTGFVIWLLPICLKKPWIGVLSWCWLTFMNPHQLCWGFARTLPFAQIIAIVTLIGIFVSPDKERRGIPFTIQTQLLVGFWLVITFTTIFAWYPERAWDSWEKTSKIFLFVFLSLMYFQNRERLRSLFLVLALSYGFYGLKGGLWVFTSANPSGGMVLGPQGGCMTCGNNGLALAFCMILPFLLFLWREETRPWLRKVLMAMIVMTPIATLFTFARTGLVTLPVVLVMLFMRSRRKVWALVVIGVFAFGVMNYAPERLFERAQSIKTHTDGSSQMRLESWYVAWRFALDNPLGGGFWVLDHDETFGRYLQTYLRAQSAHNIYLEVLADHGFPGLAIYVGIIISSFMTLFRLKWRLRNNVEAEWIVNYCRMIQISLTAFMIGGMFLPLSYWDLFYHIVSFVVLLRAIAVKESLRNAVQSKETMLEPWQVQVGASRS